MINRHVDIKPIGLKLNESLPMILASLAICVPIFFREPFIAPVLVIIAIVFCASYVNAFEVPHKILTGICGIISSIFTVTLTFTLSEYSLEHGIIVPFVLVVFFSILLAYIFEMIKRNRSGLIVSVSHTVTLSLCASCICGFALTWKLVGGLYIAYILMNLVPFFAAGFSLLVLTPFKISEKWKNRVKLLIAVATVFAVRYTLPHISSLFIIRAHDMWYAAFTVFASLAVTDAHYGKPSTYQEARTKAVFPIATIGIFVYLVCILVQI